MEKWKRIWPWVTSAMLTAVAVVLIICCVSIYRSGSRPFTPETIAQYAGRFAWLGILSLIAVFIGLLIPASVEKAKALRDLKDQLARYQGELPENSREQKRCKSLRLGLGLAIGALSVYPIVYLCDMSNFSATDINGAVRKASLVVLIPTVIGMCLTLILRGLELCSIQRQLDLLRAAGIKPGKAAGKPACVKKLTAIRAIILAAALVMIVVGAINGGAADVLGKAIRICTECIGLG